MKRDCKKVLKMNLIHSRQTEM